MSTNNKTFFWSDDQKTNEYREEPYINMPILLKWGFLGA